MEEKKESRSSVYDEVITKNQFFYLQECIKAILKCLGFESSKLVHQASSSSSSSSSSSMLGTNNKEEEEESEKQEQECVLFHEDGNKQGSDSTNDNYENDPPVETNDEDPTQSETPILATDRRGRPPSRPKVGSGPPPQNN
ncbi:hypothetical protein EJD97_014268 [Solanum chilense]|uniref:Uncharacterized protein n=1 Tax=Solanum chilense TaxID=4083 RepID=A0A6N2B9G6_SOLCI|nr:hypothetical protein EJD97_014268 [Solanum chilense]